MDFYSAARLVRWIFWMQGLYFAATGVWPIVNLQGFLAFTGPKTDLWLVQTIGAVLAVIGISLCAAGATAGDKLSACVLAIGAAAVLMVVEIVFVAERVISPIYLLDAGAEAGLLIAWAVAGYSVLRGAQPTTGREHLAVAWR